MEVREYFFLFNFLCHQSISSLESECGPSTYRHGKETINIMPRLKYYSLIKEIDLLMFTFISSSLAGPSCRTPPRAYPCYFFLSPSLRTLDSSLGPALEKQEDAIVSAHSRKNLAKVESKCDSHWRDQRILWLRYNSNFRDSNFAQVETKTATMN